MRGNFLAVASIFIVAFATTFAHPTITSAHDALDIKGVWATAERDSEIEIYDCVGGNICGRVISMTEPNDENGGQQKDVYNKEESLRDRLILGLEFLTRFTVDSGSHAKLKGGRIYSPRNGKTYKATLVLREDDTLQVRGFVGISLFRQTEIWTRVSREKAD